MRVVTIWGKARLGIWWWGRRVAGQAPASGMTPQRTAWIVRKAGSDDLDSGEDCWEVLHEHKGNNKGFDKALELFLQAMPAMAAAAESIAKAIGAPFLRSDFFVGSDKWGVRLNEVAYGSGVDVRSRCDSTGAAIDDGPIIARILQEGFKHCKRAEARQFMELLGADSADYKSMNIVKLRTQSETLGVPLSPEARRPRLPSYAIRGFQAAALEVSPCAAADCDTGKNSSSPIKMCSPVAQYRQTNVVEQHALGAPIQQRLQGVVAQPGVARGLPVPAPAQHVIAMPGGLPLGATGRAGSVKFLQQARPAPNLLSPRTLAPIAELRPKQIINM